MAPAPTRNVNARITAYASCRNVFKPSRVIKVIVSSSLGADLIDRRKMLGAIAGTPPCMAFQLANMRQ